MPFGTPLSATEARPDARPDVRYVLTGPSGWIGTAMLAALAERLAGTLGHGWADRVVCFGSVARTLAAAGAVVPVRALETIAPADVAGAHVIHLAYLTREKAAELGERGFVDTNLAIDDVVLAAISREAPASLFTASSGAAQMAARGQDLHPYGLAKLRQEARFLEWGHAAGVPVLAGRIFNLAGPYINKVEAYAIANFATQARSTGKITIAATAPVFRSFLHVADLCALVLDCAHRRLIHDAPVDLCGAEVVEMADLADLVARSVGGKVRVLRGAVDTARPSAYLGDFTQTRVLAMQVGRGLAPLRQQVDDTVAWLDRAHAAPNDPENSRLTGTC